MPTVVVKTGPEAGRRVELDLEVAIGRQEGDLVVEDPEVSRRHAVLRRSGGSVVVERHLRQRGEDPKPHHGGSR